MRCGDYIVSDTGTAIHPHPRPHHNLVPTSSPHRLSPFPHQLCSFLFYSMDAKLRPCFRQTTTSMLLNWHRQCHCHSFTLHLLSPWTNSRSSTASALSCLTVTAVITAVTAENRRGYGLRLSCQCLEVMACMPVLRAVVRPRRALSSPAAARSAHLTDATLHQSTATATQHRQIHTRPWRTADAHRVTTHA